MMTFSDIWWEPINGAFLVTTNPGQHASSHMRDARAVMYAGIAN